VQDVVHHAKDGATFWPAVPRYGVCGATREGLYPVDMMVAPLNVGLLYVFALAGQGIVGAAIAGWASDNKFSLMGALRAASQMVSYEVTMGLSLIGAMMIYGTIRLDDMVRWQGENTWGIFVQPVAFFLFFAVIFGIVLHATPLGRAIFAIGANREAAFFAGIRVKRIKFWLFVLSGAMSGFAGVLWTLRFASARYDSGVGMELIVVTIVLLGGVSIFGGRGTIFGVVVAAAVLGCLQTALTADLIPAQDQNIVVGTLLIASVIVPNAGDLYRRGRARWQSMAARRHAAAAQAETQ